MIEVPAVAETTRRGIGAKLWGGVLAAWAVVTGAAPHVLHHVGPLAGAALLAGFGGQVIFFVLGLVLSLPLLRRLYRHFQSWLAPALAVLVFAAAFTFSNLVVAPQLTGEGAPATPLEQPDHVQHHPEGEAR